MPLMRCQYIPQREMSIYWSYIYLLMRRGEPYLLYIQVSFPSIQGGFSIKRLPCADQRPHPLPIKKKKKNNTVQMATSPVRRHFLHFWSISLGINCRGHPFFFFFFFSSFFLKKKKTSPPFFFYEFFATPTFAAYS